jgi:competence ComEA-like helix-hairpin-helix protein
MDAPDRILERNARAALALAALLLLAALPWRAPRSAQCPRPVSVEARDGRTWSVRCEGPPGLALAGPAQLLFGEGLDANVADAASLAVLPGVGLERAGAIVRAREEKPLLRLEDLQRVPGIGPATLERLRPWLRFPAGATKPAAVDPAEPGN